MYESLCHASLASFTNTKWTFLPLPSWGPIAHQECETKILLRKQTIPNSCALEAETSRSSVETKQIFSVRSARAKEDNNTHLWMRLWLLHRAFWKACKIHFVVAAPHKLHRLVILLRTISSTHGMTCHASTMSNHTSPQPWQDPQQSTLVGGQQNT